MSPDWPIYAAGIDQDDELREIDGQQIRTDADLAAALNRHNPGDVVTIAFTTRAGATTAAQVKLAENPHLEVVPLEAAGGTLTPAQREFRERWLKASGR